MARWIDPPGGWQYGFPRLYDAAQDGSLREFLITHDYPEKDLDFALEHLRSWSVE